MAIIDNVGEMAILMALAQECSKMSSAAMDRIQELQKSGRADLRDDPAMHELIRRSGNMLGCLEMLSRRYPDLADEVERQYHVERIQQRKKIRKNDSLIRNAGLNYTEGCDSMKNVNVKRQYEKSLREDAVCLQM